MGQHSLWTYVLAALIVFALINLAIYYVRPELQPRVLQHTTSFLLGMLAMYIAVHVYSWK